MDGITRSTKSVIIKDFYGWMKHNELLKIAGRYSYQVPLKEGFINFRPTVIFITCNLPIERWYKFPNYDSAAIKRRIEHHFIEHVQPAMMYITEQPSSS